VVKEDILGHKRQLRVLEKIIERKRIPHALLFEGPEGIGKKKVALWFLSALNCETEGGKGCKRCSSCLKIERLTHPDLYLLGSQGDSIKIEQVREAEKFLQYKPLEAKWKGLVVEDADKMTPEAANAFLKSLEEPPPWTVIILITQSSDTLPPTIRSRCQRLRFFPLSVKETEEILRKMGLKSAFLESGSPGLILRLSKEALDLETLLSKVKKGGIEAIIEISEEIGRDRNKALAFLRSLLPYFRDQGKVEGFWKTLEIYRLLEEYANPRLCVEAALLELLSL
jgi:DNA polymerase-3 subunit delta'